MRTLFVGDVHGCAPSLRALVDRARPDRVVLVGDLFAKGPDPRGVWDVIRATRAEAVLGNHDAKMLAVWGQGDDAGVHAWACRQLPDEARDWIAALPLFLFGPGWMCVHAGVHPFEGVAGTTRKVALTVRRWPDDLDPKNPFWWELYQGETRVVYGHDAMRGLQKHARTVGLDTGCVYGQLLTGWVLEDDEVLQVEGNR